MRRRSRSCSRCVKWTASRGLSLIEVLAVLGVIGLLTALLAPAIQQARESARLAQCKNNLRQIGVAAQAFHDQHGHLKTIPLLESLLPQMGESAIVQLEEAKEAAVLRGEWLDTSPIVTPASYVCPSDSLANRAKWHASYAVNRGLTLDWNSGMHTIAHSFGERRFSEITDGLSQTALLSEKLVLLPDVEFVSLEMARQYPQRFFWNADRHFQRNEHQAQYEYYISPNVRAQVGRGSFWHNSFLGQSPFYHHTLPPGNWSFDGRYIIGPSSATSEHSGGVHLLHVDGHVDFVSEHVDHRAFWSRGTIAGGETQEGS